MRILRPAIITIFIAAFLYWGAAAITFKFRHPKANDTVLITQFGSVITFSTVQEFQ